MGSESVGVSGSSWNSKTAVQVPLSNEFSPVGHGKPLLHQALNCDQAFRMRKSGGFNDLVQKLHGIVCLNDVDESQTKDIDRELEFNIENDPKSDLPTIRNWLEEKIFYILESKKPTLSDARVLISEGNIFMRQLSLAEEKGIKDGGILIGGYGDRKSIFVKDVIWPMVAGSNKRKQIINEGKCMHTLEFPSIFNYDWKIQEKIVWREILNPNHTFYLVWHRKPDMPLSPEQWKAREEARLQQEKEHQLSNQLRKELLEKKRISEHNKKWNINMLPELFLGASKNKIGKDTLENQLNFLYETKIPSKKYKDLGSVRNERRRTEYLQKVKSQLINTISEIFYFHNDILENEHKIYLANLVNTLVFNIFNVDNDVQIELGQILDQTNNPLTVHNKLLESVLSVASPEKLPSSSQKGVAVLKLNTIFKHLNIIDKISPIDNKYQHDLYLVYSNGNN